VLSSVALASLVYLNSQYRPMHLAQVSTRFSIGRQRGTILYRPMAGVSKDTMQTLVVGNVSRSCSNIAPDC